MIIPDALYQQVIQQLTTTTGATDWSLHSAVIAARECHVFKLSSPQFQHDIALKIYRKAKYASMPQYKVLERLSPLMNTAGNHYLVPKPYGSLPEQHAFLMEWVGATSLHYRLWRYFYLRDHQQDGMRRTLQWLRHFHQHNNRQVKPVNIEHYRARLQRFMTEHDGQQLLAGNSVFAQGIKDMSVHLEHFAAAKVGHAWQHGDFTPGNVLLADREVTGIDITGSEHLPVVNDLTLLLTYIAIGYPNMLTRGDMRQPPQQWPLLKVFLEAYGYPDDAEDLRFLLLVFLYQLLRRWLVVAHRHKHHEATWLDRWRLRNLEMIVGGVCTTLRV